MSQFQFIIEIVDALGTISLAMAAFYQIYHTEHKTEALRPKLIIFPEFIGTPSPSGIMFYVYNVGKSIAKHCNVNLTIIYKTPVITKSRHIYWTWNEYNKTTSQSGVLFDTSSDDRNFININPTQKVSLSHLMVNTLYEEPLADNQKIPSAKFTINVEIYSENMTTAASYPIELEWTGSAFDDETDQIKRELKLRDELEQRLWKEKSDELLNLRESALYKRKHKRKFF